MIILLSWDSNTAVAAATARIAPMFLRRRIRAGIALLLPLMVLRALLPPGYMPVATEGGLQIVMCSAGLTQADEGPSGKDHPQTADSGQCLFSHAATFAPPSATPCCTVTPPASRFDVFTVAYQPPATGPPRLTAARGPPVYS